ncbi:MAG TPA: hypothetical protein PKH07_14350, partial [bacterium]|nr:hypothetical protein [bacterium]
AADQARNLVYSVNRETNSVSVINGNTNAVIETFPVGRDPEDAILIPDLNRLLVALKSEHSLAVVDVLTRTVLEKKYLGSELGEDKRPHRIAYNSLTGKAYVSNSWSGDVSVLSVKPFAFVENIQVDSGTKVYGIAVNEVSNEVYVSDAYGRVAVIDGSTDSVSSYVDLGGKAPNALAYDSVADRMFLTCFGFPTPKEILVVTRKQLTGAIAMPEPILSLLVDESSRRLYATGFIYGKLYEVDMDTLNIVSSTDVGWEGLAQALNKSTGCLYVGGHKGGAYSVVRVGEKTVPEPPEIISVTGDSQALVEWTSGNPASLFNVYRSRSSAGPFVRLNYAPLPAHERRFIDPTVVNGNTYFYAMSGVDEHGVEGALSAPGVAFVPQESVTPDFRLSSVEVAVALQPATSATATLLLQPLNGFSSKVSLSAVSVPDGLTLSFDPQETFAPAAVVFSVTASPLLLPCVLPVVIGASASGYEKDLYFFVNVRETSAGGIRVVSFDETQDAVLRQGIQVMLTTDVGSHARDGLVTLKGRIQGVPSVSSCRVIVTKPDGSVENVDNVMVTNGMFGLSLPVLSESEYGIWRAVVVWQG